MKMTAVFSFLFFVNLCLARGHYPQSPGFDALKQVSEHNQKAAFFEEFTSEVKFDDQSVQVLPFAEYQTTGYLFFNDSDYYGQVARGMKKTIAENLPSNVTLVVYTTVDNDIYLKKLKKKYLQYRDESQLIILKLPKTGTSDFWSRDNLPVPVWSEGVFTLVDARYYYGFEPDDFLVSLFSTSKTHHDFFFEGGNLVANARGECLVVNRKVSYPGGVSDTAAIPDSIFKNQYGCKELTRFKHLKGIGHADEVVKFMTDDIIVTNTPEYVNKLERLGYQVHLLPESGSQYETYVNSLQVNDVLFVPSFGKSHDQKAVEIYEDLNLGFKIVTVPSRRLAQRGNGGPHCIAMNYPPAALSEIIFSFKAKIY